MSNLHLMGSWQAITALFLFIVAYILVICEEKIDFRKSKPVIVASGIIWLLVALSANSLTESIEINEKYKHNLLEYAEILLFLLVAMSYVNILDDRNVFEAIRSYLVKSGWTYRKLFFITGIIAFFLSSVADNLTASLLMGTVVMAVGRENKAFVAIACINVVVASNAGGAFSPFGDITTLMVWQEGKVKINEFCYLFFPSLIMWLIPAYLMCRTLPKEDRPSVNHERVVKLKVGAKRICLLFALTIATAVIGHNQLHLPPVWGMILGLGYVKLFGYYLRIKCTEDIPFDIMRHIQEQEWDTLLFFLGVIMSVGGLSYFGYLTWLSSVAYTDWSWFAFSHETSVTGANILVGIASAVIDNIPIMFAVLSMNPDMSIGQWLLVTLTAGVGGSLLSIGSAAGVALMGVSNGAYTFSSHWRWTWAIALGYIASIITHLIINSHLF